MRAASTLSHARALAALLALVALGLVAAAASSEPAAAASACAKRVVDDWFDNGRVDNLYPLYCYRQAIKSLPGDARDYSSAEEDIRRALQYATRGKSDPGNGAPAQPPAPSPSPAPSPPASPPPPATTSADPPPAPPPSPTTTAPEPEPVDTGMQTEAGAPVDSAGASSIPMPLIVLGGLALLLLAAGSAGYVTRRLQSRGGDGGEPPAAA